MTPSKRLSIQINRRFPTAMMLPCLGEGHKMKVVPSHSHKPVPKSCIKQLYSEIPIQLLLVKLNPPNPLLTENLLVTLDPVLLQVKQDLLRQDIAEEERDGRGQELDQIQEAKDPLPGKEGRPLYVQNSLEGWRDTTPHVHHSLCSTGGSCRNATVIFYYNDIMNLCNL